MKSKDNIGLFRKIWSAFEKADSVLLSLHARPDGDSLGSCAAMKYVLERDLGKKVTLVSYDPLPEYLNVYQFVNEIKFGTDISDLDLGSFDVVGFLDSSSPKSFSGKLRDKFSMPHGVRTIVLDHHHTAEGLGEFSYIDENAPSACSVVLDFFRVMKVRFDSELCRRLLVGLCTDTGFFAYNTSPLKALQDAVFLIEQGKLDYYYDAVIPLRSSVPLKLKRLQALVVQNLKVDVTGKIGYSSIALSEINKIGLNESDIRGGISVLQDIEGLEMVFTLTERSDGIKGSFRALRDVDVSRFAVALGGGGHISAAAFQLPKMPLPRAEGEVLAVIKKIGFHRAKSLA